MPVINQGHDYQEKAIADTFEAWENDENVCLVAPTGAGKTIIKGLMARYFLQRKPDTLIVIFAHRDVLLSQISLAAAKVGLPHRLLCAKTTERQIGNEHMAELNESFISDHSSIIVASVPTWIKRNTSHLDSLIGLWLMDECFTPSALIDGKSIREVLVGDYVTAFNETNGQFEQREVVRLFKNKEPSTMIRIVTKGHHVLHCTSGHPFWTKRGWVEAINLTPYDEVLINDLSMYSMPEKNTKYKRASKVSSQENWKNILLKGMWLSLQNLKRKEARQDYVRSSLFLLQNKVRRWLREIKPRETHRENLLFKRVFNQLSKIYIIKNNDQNQQIVCQCKNEGEQPYETPFRQEKSIRDIEIHRSQTSGSRWEWQTRNFSRINIKPTIFKPWFQKSVNCKNRFERWCRELSNPLQNRLWKPTVKNSNRGRWVKSLLTKKTSTRPEKREISYWQRLDSVEIYQSGDSRYSHESKSDGYVYNIEVEGLHTYVANNITVHNCHHLLRENMWGKCVEPMVNALGLGVTATPCRADGKGLGRHASGVFDTIVETPDMGELIAMGRLSPYKVYTIPNDIDFSTVNTTSSGELNQKKLDKATRKSHITGDSVVHYKRIANGKQTIIFSASVAHSDQVAEEFRVAGFSAVALSSKTDITTRQQEINKFKRGKTQILVNYDLFGEGFDVPAVEVVIMLRKTLSYGLYKQMLGRCLRVFEGKLYGILIDHVGNVIEHQIPGKHLHEDPEWSLDDAKPKGKGDAGDLFLSRTCPECFSYYVPKSNTINDFVCPSCAHEESKEERSAALHEIQVRQCDLIEYDTGFLTEVLKEIKKVDTPIEVFKHKMANAPNVVKYSAIKNHEIRQAAQSKLRYWIGHWCDVLNKHLQVNENAIRDEFHRMFKVDIYTAQTLSGREATELNSKIKDSLFDIIFCKVI